MSREEVDLAQRLFDAFNRRDLDTFLVLMEAEVDFTTRFLQLEGAPEYHGHNGVRDWWRDLLAIFPDFRAEMLEARDLGDFVVTTVRVRGHGLDSDTPIEETLWGTAKSRQGRVLWWQTFRSEAEALAAAGLSE